MLCRSHMYKVCRSQELMNSVTIGDLENCGLRRMHLGQKSASWLQRNLQHFVREEVSKTSLPLLKKLGSKSSCRTMSKLCDAWEYPGSNIQTRLFLGSSGIEASDKGNALTRLCLRVSNSEYLKMNQSTVVLKGTMQTTYRLRRVILPPLNVSMVQLHTTYAPIPVGPLTPT